MVVLDHLDREIAVGQIIAYAPNGCMAIYKVAKLNMKNPDHPTISAYEYIQIDMTGPFYRLSEKTVRLSYPGDAIVLPDGYADIRNEMLPNCL